MLKTLVGDEGYRKATDLYFERHDGQAATVEDWVKCFEDACGRDLKQFRLWYRAIRHADHRSRGRLRRGEEDLCADAEAERSARRPASRRRSRCTFRCGSASSARTARCR